MKTAFATMLVCLTGLSCSPDASHGDGGAPGSGGNDTASEGGAATDTGGSAAGTGGSGTEPTSGRKGTVMFFEQRASPVLFAAFSEGRGRSCPPLRYGDCTVPDMTCSGSEPQTRPTAGTVSYESPGVGTIAGTPNENGIYSTSSFDGPYPGFLGGEEGIFRGTGGEVPAFEQRLDYPLLALLDQPSGVDGMITVSKNQDLVLQWSRGGEGMVIWVRPEDFSGPALECLLDASTGQGVVPAAVLKVVPSGARLELYSLATTKIQAGEYEVSLYSGGAMRTPDKVHMVSLVVQ